MFPVAGKGAAAVLGSLLQKGEEGQNWINVAKEAILLAAGTVLNEAANRVKHGGRGKKKMKKLRRSKVDKAAFQKRS